MFRIALTIAAGCLLSSIVWFVFFVGLYFLRRITEPGIVGFALDDDPASMIKMALAVGFVHGLFIAVGNLLARPVSLPRAVFSGLLAGEVLAVVLVIVGAYWLTSSGGQITIASVAEIVAFVAVGFLIVSLLLLIPTAGIAAGLLKIQGVMGTGQ